MDWDAIDTEVWRRIRAREKHYLPPEGASDATLLRAEAEAVRIRRAWSELSRLLAGYGGE